jgi:hypothetical protein
MGIIHEHNALDWVVGKGTTQPTTKLFCNVL